MIAAPKPPARAPKARKPIARRRAKPRTVKTSCLVRGCKKAPVHIARCGSHADEYLLKLRRAIVVGDRQDCELADWHETERLVCRGPLQDNHGFDRGYKRGNLRWDPANGLRGCASANLHAKYHREEWHDYLRRRWGIEKYEAMRLRTLHGPMPDYDAALAMLLGPTGQGQDRNEEA